MLVEAFVAQPTVEAFNKAVLNWLTGGDVVLFYLLFLLPSNIAFDVNSVPLSLTIMRGLTRLWMIGQVHALRAERGVHDESQGDERDPSPCSSERLSEG